MFSVIIPLHNKVLSVKNTIQSVLDQTFNDFEILVINDGSTDGSLEVVKQIKDARIRIIEKKNGGVSSARNRGIAEAKYEWIAFLDGDDLWMEDHLQHIFMMMNTFPKEKVFVTSFKYSDNRPVFRNWRNDEILVVANYFEEAMKGNLMWTSVVVINQQCFQIAGKFNEHLSRGEDLDLWARVAKHFTIVKSGKITGIYKVDSENKLTSGKSKFKDSVLSVISLKNTRGSERQYYKRMILTRIKTNIKDLSLRENIYLIIKYNLQLFR